MLGDILNAIKGQWSPLMVRVTAEKRIVSNGAYTILDVISESISAGTPWVFENAARSKGGGGYITTALLTAETTNIASWLSLFLFTDTPTCVVNDAVTNTAPLLVNRHFYVGRIDFPSCDDIGTGMSETMATPSTVGKLPMGFVCKHDSRKLQGILAIRNAGMDLADNTRLTISLIIEQY